MMSIFHHLQAGTGRILQGKGLRHLQLTLNLLILAGWIWLYYPVFSYLKILFSHEEFRTNQVLLAAVAGLLFVRAREAYQDGQRWNLSSQTAPHLWLPGLGLALGGSLAYLLAERYLDINTLSATLFGLASYGMLGLWIAPQRWRASLPAALLVIGVLPFGEHMQTFIGYPLRAITAAWVQHGLLAMGVQSVGVDTILVFENSVTQVDIPCSGVKSLWTGSLFWLAATWIDARRVNLRWLLAALVFGLLLLLANFARVAILTLVGAVAGWTLLAEMIHVPLGVIGFIAACGFGLLMLRRVPPAVITTPALPARRPARAPAWFSLLLALVLAGMALVYTPRPQAVLGQAEPKAWAFPGSIQVEPLELSVQEQQVFTEMGADSSSRYRFESADLSGSMILISSSTWRAQHKPERCFQVYGLTVESGQTRLVAPGFPIRALSLSFAGGDGRLSAAYWMQSADRTTDDFATRIWDDLGTDRTRWVLVTILFDREVENGTAELQSFYRQLHQVVAHRLAGAD